MADIDPLNRSIGSRVTSRRNAARDSLFLSATIRKVGESNVGVLPVRVRNLSAIGLMADHDGISLPGDRVVVTVRGIGDIAGRVAWVRNNRIGLAFDAEVDPKLARKPVKPMPEPPSKPRKLF